MHPVVFGSKVLRASLEQTIGGAYIHKQKTSAVSAFDCARTTAVCSWLEKDVVVL